MALLGTSKPRACPTTIVAVTASPATTSAGIPSATTVPTCVDGSTAGTTAVTWPVATFSRVDVRCNITASPMHMIFHELISQENFIYLYMDEEREQLIELAKRMEPFWEKMLDAVLACKAEVVYWGGNYDDNITWPAFFEEEIAPWLKKAADRLYAAGKFLLTHTDGENERLLPLYRQCEFDVADSVCPKPMTRCTLKELREGMGPDVTVWGGLCTVAFLDDSMSDASFEAFLDQTFSELGTGNRLILGGSDNVPPDANLSRLECVKERIHA